LRKDLCRELTRRRTRGVKDGTEVADHTDESSFQCAELIRVMIYDDLDAFIDTYFLYIDTSLIGEVKSSTVEGSASQERAYKVAIYLLA